MFATKTVVSNVIEVIYIHTYFAGTTVNQNFLVNSL